MKCHVILTSCHRECYYNSCAYGSSSRQECNKYYIYRRVTVDAGYVMTLTKKVSIMDIINGLKKSIIPEQ